MQRRRLDRNRADRVVRAVIASGFVDRQQLNELEPDPGRPIDKLPQRFDIADAEIVVRPQGEERRKDPAIFFRVKDSFVDESIDHTKSTNGTTDDCVRSTS